MGTDGVHIVENFSRGLIRGIASRRSAKPASKFKPKRKKNGQNSWLKLPKRKISTTWIYLKFSTVLHGFISRPLPVLKGFVKCAIA